MTLKSISRRLSIYKGTMTKPRIYAITLKRQVPITIANLYSATSRVVYIPVYSLMHNIYVYRERANFYEMYRKLATFLGKEMDVDGMTAEV